jgi:ABC-type phosphate transport system permease subunit
MMKPRMILIVAFLLAVGFPRFEQQGLSYQRFLWSSEWMKREYPSPGFLFRIGSVEDALMWNRVRLGFPFGATTIDCRLSDWVIQGRVELHALGMNLILLGIPAVALFGFIKLVRRVSLVEEKCFPNEGTDTRSTPSILRRGEDDEGARGCG